MENRDYKDMGSAFNEDAAKKWAELWAKCLMPDTKILEQLSPIENPEDFEYKDGRWSYKIKNDKNS